MQAFTAGLTRADTLIPCHPARLRCALNTALFYMAVEDDQEAAANV